MCVIDREVSGEGTNSNCGSSIEKRKERSVACSCERCVPFELCLLHTTVCQTYFLRAYTSCSLLVGDGCKATLSCILLNEYSIALTTLCMMRALHP
jgi:hypothetical protein